MNKEILNIENKNNINRRYFYSINYPVFEEDLCNMEMKCLFNKTPHGKYLFSDYYLTLTLTHNLFYQEHKHHKMDVNFILVTISEFCIILHV